ncbi:DNA polymerase III subunit gamma/tau [Woodsholea maritima]|uniref:DNA polymerase III subunit gamma/tau n=1 Tax=Woodsholea maritima TaxID=240237 RepID=UPI000368C4C3|nr:DNA polymerase III subunit gamma/tau [Woodsholea maritima]
MSEEPLASPPDDSHDGPGPDDIALPGFEAPALGGHSGQSDPGYQVLARKYRPQTFEDLIGQEAMVRTLTHAFGAGRIAQAYMLTGVRGVGKTTTARLIARALNYESDQVNAPSMILTPPGRHCAAIAKSSHVDVMEMDAASRTGVGDMREILDSVRYGPVSARYKVYIIDEVHMLSTAAFNALLKTLEEPPPHAKFIFATTEIRKVPVTVLSRCQRFDLKRIDRDVLADHLGRIAQKEGAEIARDGLIALARAAEGSVRDGLSLLDQAIVQAEGDGPVSEAQIRDMLGLADRSRVLDLLDAALEGRGPEALKEVRHQYDSGADPVVLVRDLLDYLHAMARVKAAGDAADLGESVETTARLARMAQAQSLGALARLWKIMLGGLDDVRAAPDPVAAAEMVVIRLMAAGAMPGPEEAARLLAGLQNGAVQMTPQATGAPPQGEAPPGPDPRMADPAQPEDPGAGLTGPTTLEGLIAMLAEARDLEMKLNVERCVRLISMKPGQLVFQPTKTAPPNLANELSRFLQDATGQAWMVLAERQREGGETLYEKREREAREHMERAARDPVLVKAMALFPGAEILSVEAMPAPVEAPDEDEAGSRDGHPPLQEQYP